VRLSPLGTSATVGLLYQPQMVDDECGVVGGMRIGRGNRSTRRKPVSVPLCPPQIPHDLGSNPGRRGGKPATNPLSYGTANVTGNSRCQFSRSFQRKSTHGVRGYLDLAGRSSVPRSQEPTARPYSPDTERRPPCFCLWGCFSVTLLASGIQGGGGGLPV
jgi:hypothetical protein